MTPRRRCAFRCFATGSASLIGTLRRRAAFTSGRCSSGSTGRRSLASSKRTSSGGMGLCQSVEATVVDRDILTRKLLLATHHLERLREKLASPPDPETGSESAWNDL